MIFILKNLCIMSSNDNLIYILNKEKQYMQNSFLKFLMKIYLLVVFSFSYSDYWFKIKPLKQILAENPSIECLKCFGKVSYEFPQFIVPYVSNKGSFDECFILNIPNGKIQGFKGYSLIGESFIQEMIWAQGNHPLWDIQKISENEVIHFPGKVAVLNQPAFYNYCHFVEEVLGRLALLEMHNIEYDWLYVSSDNFFMKQLLDLWGVDSEKIISPISDNFCIQADVVVMPSLLLNKDVGREQIGLQSHPYTLTYVVNKLVQKAREKNINTFQFSKKVFISRKDAQLRKILNEDEVFALFEVKGFKRYELSKLSILEQILLFDNAEIIAGEHGAGFVNILFCKPQTMIIEIFQSLLDSGFWWIASVLNLNYQPISTVYKYEIPEYYKNWQTNIKKYGEDGWADVYVSVDSVRQDLEKILK
jgi:capsular polysaccharide biosynthesis protein